MFEFRKGAPGERLFYCLFLLCICVAPGIAAGNDCAMPEPERQVTIDHVIDGDTVILGDKTRLRLIGVDTPEIDHDHRDGDTTEPGALEARRFLTESLNKAGPYPLILDREQRDRHGRLLGHLFQPGGANIQAQLLSAGLAVPLTIPPNLHFLDCYHSAAESARREQRGLWALPLYRPQNAGELDSQSRGYRIIKGTVTRIGESRTSIWINLGDDFAVRLVRGDLKWFPETDFMRLIGSTVQVHGRVYRRSGQWRIRVRHPADLFVLPNNKGNR